MSRRAERHATWPIGVRELYQSVLRTAAAHDTPAFDAAVDRLFALANADADASIRSAARQACVTLALRYDAEGLAAYLLRDGGQWALGLATAEATAPWSERERLARERLLEFMAARLPSKGRA